LKYLPVILTFAVVFAVSLAVLRPGLVGAQTPPIDLCLNIEGVQSTIPEGLVREPSGNCVLAPTPTATPVPATPTPVATHLPIFPPRVSLYQHGCGVPQVSANYEGTIIPFRLVITRNGLVLPLVQVDFFGSVRDILLPVAWSPGDLVKAYAFPQNAAPSPLPGQFFDHPAVLVATLPVSAAPPCLIAVPPTPAVATPQIIVVQAPTPLPTPAVLQAPQVITPPRTGDAGLAQ
jgi:hypothetical protein